MITAILIGGALLVSFGLGVYAAIVAMLWFDDRRRLL